MSLIKNLIPESQYPTKCPYSMSPKGICIHNTANDATAKNERDNIAKAENQAEVSFHIAIDDVEAIQCIPFNRNAWHAGDGGNGEGNRNYIAIEICYSKSGGDKFIKAEQRAAKEVAVLLKQYGWNINNVKKHQDFSNKYCPHRTLDMGWQRFLNMIQTELNILNSSSKSMFPLPLEMTSDAMTYAEQVKVYSKGDLLTADAENQWAYAIELDGKRCWVEKANVKLIGKSDERYKRFRLEVTVPTCRVFTKEVKPFYRGEYITAQWEMSGYYALDIDGQDAYIRKDVVINR